jgi:hypothetical protein
VEPRSYDFGQSTLDLDLKAFVKGAERTVCWRPWRRGSAPAARTCGWACAAGGPSSPRGRAGPAAAAPRLPPCPPTPGRPCSGAHSTGEDQLFRKLHKCGSYNPVGVLPNNGSDTYRCQAAAPQSCEAAASVAGRPVLHGRVRPVKDGQAAPGSSLLSCHVCYHQGFRAPCLTDRPVGTAGLRQVDEQVRRKRVARPQRQRPSDEALRFRRIGPQHILLYPTRMTVKS